MPWRNFGFIGRIWTIFKEFGPKCLKGVQAFRPELDFFLKFGHLARSSCLKEFWLHGSNYGPPLKSSSFWPKLGVSKEFGLLGSNFTSSLSLGFWLGLHALEEFWLHGPNYGPPLRSSDFWPELGDLFLPWLNLLSCLVILVFHAWT